MRKSSWICPAMATVLLSGLMACGSGPKKQPGTAQIKVTNGTEIEESTFPSVVMLYDRAKGALCTGTFIDDRTVLTAAHCTMGGKVVDKETGRVEVNLSYVTVKDPETKKVEVVAESQEVYRNPDWDAAFERTQVNEYDLGIIRFPAGTAPAISPIATERAAKGDELTIVGYGLNYIPKDQNDVDPSSAGTKRVGRNEVSNLQRGFIWFYGATNTTDGSGENANAASGDSGGPLFIGDQLAGVTSGGGRMLGRGVSLYVDLHTEISKKFLSSVGYDF